MRPSQSCSSQAHHSTRQPGSSSTTTTPPGAAHFGDVGQQLGHAAARRRTGSNRRVEFRRQVILRIVDHRRSRRLPGVDRPVQRAWTLATCRRPIIAEMMARMFIRPAQAYHCRPSRSPVWTGRSRSHECGSRRTFNVSQPGPCCYTLPSRLVNQCTDLVEANPQAIQHALDRVAGPGFIWMTLLPRRVTCHCSCTSIISYLQKDCRTRITRYYNR